MKRFVAVLACACAALARCAPSQGIFEMTADIGYLEKSGDVTFDRNSGEYRVTGGGENIWGREDAFHYAYKRIAGDVSMEAEVVWEGEGGNAHRKAGWMVRAGLGSDDPYVDAVVHGDGLISLQFRAGKGGETREIQSPLRAPAPVRLERHGDVFSISVKAGDGEFHPVGSIEVDLPDSVFAGLAVCSHEKGRLETARIGGVELILHGTFAAGQREIESTLERVSIEDGVRTVIHRAVQHFEAPNWSPDGSSIVFNAGGRLYRIPASGGEPEMIPSGELDNCNNDHGFSPDGSMLAVSHSPENRSLIYIIPAAGGAPRLITPNGPSYWHGWSPDGRTLAYCANRNGEYDVYTIPAAGGRERRLTEAPGLDDGPDYSPDGRYIYFNSVRSGVMQIWRMKPDGSNEERVTFDEDYADWFPHPSPDGAWIAFLSYDGSVEGHPPNKNVCLRIMPAAGGEPKIIASLFGGQGTINVPSWSPDSKSLAFVSYRTAGRK